MYEKNPEAFHGKFLHLDLTKCRMKKGKTTNDFQGITVIFHPHRGKKTPPPFFPFFVFPLWQKQRDYRDSKPHDYLCLDLVSCLN